MIKYNTGMFGIRFIFRVRGSVFPKAFCWAIPNAFLAIVYHFLFQNGYTADDMQAAKNASIMWSGYTTVLGFLIVFRNNQAYQRFWEGATLINQVKGEWFNAISSLIAFCSKEQEKHVEVKQFQHLLVRLGSLLYCCALQQVCTHEDDSFETLSLDGIDTESLEFLMLANDRCEVILQWLQQLIVDSHATGVLSIQPPILSRAFQELGRGIVNLNNCRKIKDVPFPFPYAQTLTGMMLVHWFFTPIMASLCIENWRWAGAISFFVTSAFWSLLYIARDIDTPFGDSANDLPLHKIQLEFNNSLVTLLQPRAQLPPTMNMQATEAMNRTTTVMIGDTWRRRELQKTSRIEKATRQLGSRLSAVAEQIDRRLWGNENPETPEMPYHMPPARTSVGNNARQLSSLDSERERASPHTKQSDAVETWPCPEDRLVKQVANVANVDGECALNMSAPVTGADVLGSQSSAPYDQSSACASKRSL